MLTVPIPQSISMRHKQITLEESGRMGGSITRRIWIIVFMIVEVLGFIPVLGIIGLISIAQLGEHF